MSLHSAVRAWSRAVYLVFLLALAPAFAVEPAAPASPATKDVIVYTSPMTIEAEDNGAHGKLFVAPEIVTPDAIRDLGRAMGASHGVRASIVVLGDSNGLGAGRHRDMKAAASI